MLENNKIFVALLVALSKAVCAESGGAYASRRACVCV